MLGTLITALLANPALSAMLASLLVSLLGLVLRLILKDKAAKAETNLVWGVKIAYNLVNEIARLTPNKIDDKIALGLRLLNDALAAKGQNLTPADEEKAKLLFQAMHGREKQGLDPHDVLPGGK